MEISEYIVLGHDVRTKEGHEDCIKELNSLEEMSNKSLLMSFFCSGVDFDAVREYVDEVYAEANKEEKPEFVRPSDSTPDEAKRQINKLVEEYFDTMVKPFMRDGEAETIVNAKAGLYEFACWLFNKPLI